MAHAESLSERYRTTIEVPEKAGQKPRTATWRGKLRS